MTDTFRAMCAELAEELVNEYSYCTEWEKGLPLRESNRDASGVVSELLTRARALLAQPMAEGPTDDKLMDIALATDLVFFPYKGRGCASPYMEGTDITAEVLAYARAVLAKWSHPTPEATNG